ncbi:cell division protein FtsL [candidate division WWE3 bacterium CG_4_9_14_0_2_um_filter_35_11]|uniref:Cell division protein FtsL n=1 Tax=candidate division WWE3 bacterium CG_4_9_14_0_2_um_filter_35_11 TaxID=1975077 RepID=A0A2M8ELY5_UNCKA|nr:MAG: cell division protein FtsL [candidate division WWE3 bacterium CG10_big_fil_rev_8_21_14_0_10_35_32]PJC23735.1 MAG: cell division protein FtsL [candidate division WWE3 bacterium CG_4_9_14_0_2_um_filter_35_11]
MTDRKAKNSRFPIIITLILIAVLGGILRSTFRLNSSIKKIDQAKEKIVELEETNKKLTEKIEYANTPEFIEKEATERLNLTHPGEKIIIMGDPSTTYEKKESRSANSAIKLPNWRLWLAEFKF